MGKLHDQSPSEFNVNDYRYLKPVAKLPNVPEHHNAPEPRTNGVLQSMFPPIGRNDPRVG